MHGSTVWGLGCLWATWDPIPRLLLGRGIDSCVELLKNHCLRAQSYSLLGSSVYLHLFFIFRVLSPKHVSVSQYRYSIFSKPEKRCRECRVCEALKHWTYTRNPKPSTCHPPNLYGADVVFFHSSRHLLAYGCIPAPKLSTRAGFRV